jgi:hypothetical protein
VQLSGNENGAGMELEASVGMAKRNRGIRSV